jgi:hypothetical protein
MDLDHHYEVLLDLDPQTTAPGWWFHPGTHVWDHRNRRGQTTYWLAAEYVQHMPREIIYPSLLRDMHLQGYHTKCHPHDCAVIRGDQ